MSNYFSTEIGRIHSEEMVARGLRYQAVTASKRARKQQMCLTVPRPRASYRRTLLTAGLTLVFMLLISAAAFAYPLTDDSNVSHAVKGVAATSSHVAASSSGAIWAIALVAGAVVALASAYLTGRRHSVATA
jgi:hypothetical protein